jgi:hypothetical protein
LRLSLHLPYASHSSLPLPLSLLSASIEGRKDSLGFRRYTYRGQDTSTTRHLDFNLFGPNILPMSAGRLVLQFFSNFGFQITKTEVQSPKRKTDHPVN